MSGSAGVMSNQVAKRAKTAPDFAIASLAPADPIIARMVQNRSRKEMRKYLIRCFFAVSPNDGILRHPVWNATPPKKRGHIHSCPGIQFVPASGTRAMAADS